MSILTLNQRAVRARLGRVRRIGVATMAVSLVALLSPTAPSNAAVSPLQRYAVMPKPSGWVVTSPVDDQVGVSPYVKYFADGTLFGGAPSLPQQVAVRSFPQQGDDADTMAKLADNGWLPAQFKIGSGRYYIYGAQAVVVVRTKYSLMQVEARLADMSKTRLFGLVNTIKPTKTALAQKFQMPTPRGLAARYDAQPRSNRSNWRYTLQTPTGRILVHSFDTTTELIESFSVTDSVRKTTINGIPAVETDVGVFWMPTPTQLLEVGAETPAGKNDAIAVAALLRPVSKAEWEEYSNAGPPTSPAPAVQAPLPTTDVAFGQTDKLPWKVGVQTRNGQKCYVLTVGTRTGDNCLSTASTSPIPMSWGAVSHEGSLYLWVIADPSIATVKWPRASSTAEFARVNPVLGATEGIKFGVVRVVDPAPEGPGDAVGFDAAGNQITPGVRLSSPNW